MESLVLDTPKFLELLGKLVAEVPNLQNNPPTFVPKENEAGKHVLARLEKYDSKKGGPLKIQQFNLKENRGHILIEYNPSNATKTVSFVGSHLDVVPVGDVKNWKRDPFKLTIEGNNLYGRGVTDCLGHVALLTEFFVALAEKKPALNVNVVALFIANEEAPSDDGVGVESLMKTGKIDFLKNGPVYWVDSANTHPNIGTGGVQQWKLSTKGKLFHSGLPHKGINALELAMESLSIIQRRFYEDFPAHPEESKYSFNTSSTMKPTQWEYPAGSLNQIPGEASISGDIRLTPFYDLNQVKATVQKYVSDINANLHALPVRGPSSKYELKDEGLKGKVELEWLGNGIEGIACDLKSVGYNALCTAVKEVTGDCKPFSLTGSLPLVRDLQRFGYDVQIVGFGKMEAYHAIDEYGLLNEFESAYKIVGRVVGFLNGDQKAPAAKEQAKKETPKKEAPKKEAPKKEAPKKEEKKEEEDEVDLFGSDEEDEHEKEIMRKAKEAEEKKKAAGKERPIAKSAVTLDVKPWEDTTDLVKMEEGVRAIQLEGLEWKASKLVPIGYGIKKLVIVAHVIDDKVSVDEIQEKIAELEDYVQSTDVASFSKL